MTRVEELEARIEKLESRLDFKAAGKKIARGCFELLDNDFWNGFLIGRILGSI